MTTQFGNVAMLYAKTYVQPDLDPLTLYLGADGQLWMEDVENSPGIVSSIFEVTPGLYAQSVTADGREYIAFSDLLHGQGVPLQYDGTNLDRVTQDGPGAPPTVVDYVNQIAIASVATGGSGFGETISTLTQSGNLVTLTLLGTTGFAPGQEVIVYDAPAGYNGIFTLTAVTSTTLVYYNPVSGLSPGAGGAVDLAVALVTTSTAHGENNGDFCVISGSTPGLNSLNPNNSDTGTTLSGDLDTDSTGFIVSWVSGSFFVPAMEGQSITINSQQATVATVTSPTSLVLTGQVTANQSGVAFSAPLVNPAYWQVVKVLSPTTFLISIATTDQILTGAANATGGTLNPGGQSSPGVHQVVCIFLTRNGALTAPSPPLAFTSVGNSKWALANLPIGPENVVARVFGFTGAGGDNFFVIPASVTLPNPTGLLAAPVVIEATIVPDNTSTTAIFDVPDNTLFGATAIDQIGNDLFDQRVLGPVLGFFSYASRLMAWGDFQKIENLLNMGFCGGHIFGVFDPLGWSVITGGGTLVNGGPWASGMAWQITGDGRLNPKGQLAQSAYQDAFGDPIALPNTAYSFRLWAEASAAGLAGDIIAEFTSVSTSFSSTATIPISEIGTEGGFTPLVNFTTELPSTIPSDLLFQIYAINLPNGATVLLSENEAIYFENPYNNTLVRASYALNPEGFAQTTGNLGAEDDDSAVQCLALLRTPALLETLEGIHIFEDNNGEPDTWNVNQLTRAVGAVSLRAGDPGKFGTGDAAEDWAVIASKNGVYLFAGSEFWKVSQEISRGVLPQNQDPRPTWDDINWAAQQTIVAKNDPALRRAYFAVPLNGATVPNYVFVLDYREMDTATQIASAPPVHITIQGKMKSSDLSRKWNTWNISANDIEILVRPGNQRQLFFAGGVRNDSAYGNVYSLDPSKLHDDDYGQIFPYYTTYAFTDHDQEQALGLGSDLHLYKKIHAFVAGLGLVTITPIVNSLYNFQPTLQPRILVADINSGTFLASDLEWTTVSLRGQRVFFRISVQPLPGAIDVQIRLQKFVVGMMKEPVAQYRQSGI